MSSVFFFLHLFDEYQMHPLSENSLLAPGAISIFFFFWFVLLPKNYAFRLHSDAHVFLYLLAQAGVMWVSNPLLGSAILWRSCFLSFVVEQT